MKKKSLILIAILSGYLSFNMNAQIGGNQIYQNNSNNNNYNNRNYNRKAVERASVYTTDSTLIITSKILLNQKSDYYLITVGVNQVGKTVVESNKKINTRIRNVKAKIKKMGIKNDDIYIDFISNTKLYDHKVVGREINEFFDGFNIRKNMIIKVNKLTDIDKIVDYCSEEEIHDIIKVDYVSKNLEIINEQLLAVAKKVMENKKKMFESNSSVKVSKVHRLTYEKFKIYYPKNLYKQYNEAFETTLVKQNYNNNYIRTSARKERTFYYDGIESEFGIDKAINNIAPVIGIQYILEIQVIYELKK